MIRMNQMNQWKSLATLALALTISLMLTACGGAGGESSASMPSPTSPQMEYAQNSDIGAGFYGSEKDASAQSTEPEERKIIRNASLDITAEDASELYSSIVAYGAELGGYEFSYSVSNYEAYSVIHATFKVPPERLNDFVSFIGDRGEVVNSSMSSEDITDSYYDALTRLDTKRRSLDQYYRLLRDAKGVEEIVYIQRVIDGITEDIESLEGRMRVWNSQVDMSTVNLYIRQVNDPLQIRKEINWNTLSLDDMAYLIRRGFVTMTNTILSLAQWLVVALVGYSPLWFILAAGIFLWRAWRRKRGIVGKKVKANKKIKRGKGGSQQATQAQQSAQVQTQQEAQGQAAQEQQQQQQQQQTAQGQAPQHQAQQPQATPGQAAQEQQDGSE